MTGSAGAAWPGLSYAALEAMIVGLHDADPEAVRARFRKLRLRPFPDDIRSTRGVRVAYDLPRVIAILAVFELNALYVPQGHAVSLVESTWPEWCRAAIAAAADVGHMPRPHEMPRWSSATVTVLPDAFGSEVRAVAAYSTESDARLSTSPGPVIKTDVTRLIAAIRASATDANGAALATAFVGLERSHGWTHKSFPTRLELAEIARGRGFLEEGPYLPRARALLDAKLDDDGQVVATQRARLQAMLDYVDAPVPVDAWKANVGTAEGEPRLGHLLQAWSAGIGLKPRKPQPDTISCAAGDKARTRAAALLDAIR